MKAAVLTGPRSIRVQDVPVPALESDQVMVRVEACGVCGSDVRYYKGENPWALHTLGREVPNPPNIILGHEFCGRVTQVGDRRHEPWIGKRVAVLPYRECGICEHCRAGDHNLCQNMVHLGHSAGWGPMEYYPGGMAEYCPVWARMCYGLPEDLDSEAAALLDLVGVAVHAVGVSGLRPNMDIAVIGCGPIGSSIAQIVRSWGGRRVFGIDRQATALAVLRDVQIPEAVNAGDTDPVDRVKRKTGGRGVDLVFDTVGSEQTQRQGLEMLAARGTMVNLVSNTTRFAFQLRELGAERAMRSSSNYLIPEFQMAIDLCAAGKVRTVPMVTHRFALARIEEAFGVLLEAERKAFKVIINP